MNLQLADKKKKSKEIVSIEKCDEMEKLEEELRMLQDDELKNPEPVKKKTKQVKKLAPLKMKSMPLTPAFKSTSNLE